jgi:hypothetical protein
VEDCKDNLTIDPDLGSNVDWLTELIRRFSEAFLNGRPLSNVNMRNLARLEKVRAAHILVPSYPRFRVVEEAGIIVHGQNVAQRRD